MAFTTIDDPSAYFQTALYTGNESTNVITNDGNSDLQPDWWWGADRTGTNWNSIYDSSRGVTKQLNTNVTNSEYTVSNGMASFNSDGFTLGSHDNSNKNSHNHVAWQWKANGGTTASNSDGDITSTVQANTTAGFSIVTYTGNGNDGNTVGHGLSGNWDLCILKNRGQTDYWTFSTTGTNQVLLLHDTSAQANHSTAYMTKSSGVIGLVGAGDLGMVNNSNETYVAYVFKQIQGYSKFGSYTGNGNVDGPFVYTGFSPAWIMFKSTSATGSWQIYDSKRQTFNDGSQPALKADATDAEFSKNVDILSNGVKLRDTTGDANASGVTYIYMAFAEHPFVLSEGVPTTAR